jgi:hypothetical protein
MIHAARRSGFAPQTLFAILGRAGVAVRHAYPSAPRGCWVKSSWTYVERDEVDRAVAIALEQESIQQAARRIGVTNHTLGKALRATGVVYEYRRRFLAEPRFFDAAIATYLETILPAVRHAASVRAGHARWARTRVAA